MIVSWAAGQQSIHSHLLSHFPFTLFISLPFAPPTAICDLFIYLTFFLLAHVFLVMLLRQSCTSFFCFNAWLLMNFPPANCSGSLRFTWSKSARKLCYRNLPFRSFEWKSPGVHKSGYKIKVLAIALFYFCSATIYLFHIFLLRSSVHID